MAKKLDRLLNSIRFSFSKKAARIADAMNEVIQEDGGPGSGNWGHKGRPGKVGGSGKGGGKQYRGSYNESTGKYEKKTLSDPTEMAYKYSNTGINAFEHKPGKGAPAYVPSFKKDPEATAAAAPAAEPEAPPKKYKPNKTNNWLMGLQGPAEAKEMKKHLKAAGASITAVTTNKSKLDAAETVMIDKLEDNPPGAETLAYFHVMPYLDAKAKAKGVNTDDMDEFYMGNQHLTEVDADNLATLYDKYGNGHHGDDSATVSDFEKNLCYLGTAKEMAQYFGIKNKALGGPAGAINDQPEEAPAPAPEAATEAQTAPQQAEPGAPAAEPSAEQPAASTKAAPTANDPAEALKKTAGKTINSAEKVLDENYKPGDYLVLVSKDGVAGTFVKHTDGGWGAIGDNVNEKGTFAPIMLATAVASGHLTVQSKADAQAAVDAANAELNLQISDMSAVDPDAGIKALNTLPAGSTIAIQSMAGGSPAIATKDPTGKWSFDQEFAGIPAGTQVKASTAYQEIVMHDTPITVSGPAAENVAGQETTTQPETQPVAPEATNAPAEPQNAQYQKITEILNDPDMSLSKKQYEVQEALYAAKPGDKVTSGGMEYTAKPDGYGGVDWYDQNNTYTTAKPIVNAALNDPSSFSYKTEENVAQSQPQTAAPQSQPVPAAPNASTYNAEHMNAQLPSMSFKDVQESLEGDFTTGEKIKIHYTSPDGDLTLTKKDDGDWEDEDGYGWTNAELASELKQGGKFLDLPGASPDQSGNVATQATNGNVATQATSSGASAPKQEITGAGDMFGQFATSGNLKMNEAISGMSGILDTLPTGATYSIDNGNSVGVKQPDGTWKVTTFGEESSFSSKDLATDLYSVINDSGFEPPKFYEGSGQPAGNSTASGQTAEQKTDYLKNNMGSLSESQIKSQLDSYAVGDSITLEGPTGSQYTYFKQPNGTWKQDAPNAIGHNPAFVAQSLKNGIKLAGGSSGAGSFSDPKISAAAAGIEQAMKTAKDENELGQLMSSHLKALPVGTKVHFTMPNGQKVISEKVGDSGWEYKTAYKNSPPGGVQGSWGLGYDMKNAMSASIQTPGSSAPTKVFEVGNSSTSTSQPAKSPAKPTKVQAPASPSASPAATAAVSSFSQKILTNKGKMNPKQMGTLIENDLSKMPVGTKAKTYNGTWTLTKQPNGKLGWMNPNYSVPHTSKYIAGAVAQYAAYSYNAKDDPTKAITLPDASATAAATYAPSSSGSSSKSSSYSSASAGSSQAPASAKKSVADVSYGGMTVQKTVPAGNYGTHSSSHGTYDYQPSDAQGTTMVVNGAPVSTNSPAGFVNFKYEHQSEQHLHESNGFKAWANGLTSKDKQGLNTYKSWKYKPINDGLAAGKVPHEYKSDVQAAHDAIAKSTLDQSMVMYSGAWLKHIMDAFPGIKNATDLIGKTWTDPAFLSSGASYDGSWNKDSIFCISTPAGKGAGCFVDGVNGLVNSGENEYLYNAFSMFEITDVKFEAPNGGSPKWHIYMTYKKTDEKKYEQVMKNS